MLETNIFVILFYSREIHVMQRDFEVLALVVYVGHRRTCDVTLFCVIRCFFGVLRCFRKALWDTWNVYIRTSDPEIYGVSLVA